MIIWYEHIQSSNILIKQWNIQNTLLISCLNDLQRAKYVALPQ